MKKISLITALLLIVACKSFAQTIWVKNEQDPRYVAYQDSLKAWQFRDSEVYYYRVITKEVVFTLGKGEFVPLSEFLKLQVPDSNLVLCCDGTNLTPIGYRPLLEPDEKYLPQLPRQYPWIALYAKPTKTCIVTKYSLYSPTSRALIGWLSEEGEFIPLPENELKKSVLTLEDKQLLFPYYEGKTNSYIEEVAARFRQQHQETKK